MNKIILTGKAASGKDHLRKILEGRGFIYGISYTTRPRRNNEKDGNDYYFISDQEFKDKINSNFWYEWSIFNGWYYGTSKEQFNDKCNLFIMTPIGISNINTIDRNMCTVIYLDIPINERMNRLKSRFMPGDSLDRRLIEDEKDFEIFKDFDLRITDPNF